MTRKALFVTAVTSGCSALSALLTGERWVFLIAAVLWASAVIAADFLFHRNGARMQPRRRRSGSVANPSLVFSMSTSEEQEPR